MNYRFEKDTMGWVAIPADKWWGPVTQRFVNNFPIGTEKMPMEIVYALTAIKRGAAIVNNQLGKLSDEKASAIIKAADEVLQGKWNDQFPLAVWQIGSGTGTNMNVNEVIANIGNYMLSREGSSTRLKFSDVNMSQSSNDTIPSAIYIASVLAVEHRLIPALSALKTTFYNKSIEYKDIIKLGRTHLQDAVPLTLGQEISGWYGLLEKDELMIRTCIQFMKELAIGGTAVGTGFNAPPEFGKLVAEQISKYTGIHFTSNPNKFQALSSMDELAFTHGALTVLSADLMKIANDIRLLFSGPRGGIGEIFIPANEPGSSIMPGKVNPSQSEALIMVVTEVMGNNTTITIALSQGNLQNNVFLPVTGYNFLQSTKLLTDAMNSFNARLAVGIRPNYNRIKQNLYNSLELATALTPYIGYDKTAQIVQLAETQGLTLREAALKTGFVTKEQFDEIVDPTKLIGPTPIIS